jgi:cytochrome c-type biogenesis protein CcmE
VTTPEKPVAPDSTPATIAKPSTLFTPKIRALFTLVMVVGALTYFAFVAFRGATVNYHTVAQALTLAPTAVDRQIGVKGKLVKGSFARSPSGLVANFQVRDEDGANTLQVSYSGEVGQVFFNEHSEIILQGAIGKDHVFAAEQLTVRCPSKYLTEQEKAELEAQDGGRPAPPPYQPDYFKTGT